LSLLPKLVVWLYLALLGIWLVLWFGRLPHHIDASLYAYPDHWVNYEAFHQSLLPLWNPYIACGTPHAANWQSACFYPPFWLFNWTGLANGFMPMAVAHAGWAFAGCALWLRRQKAGPLGCFLGALSFAGSAHLTLCWNNLPFIATAAWIPWVFWAFDRSFEKPGLKNGLLAAGILSLQVLAGYPFFTFYTVLLLLVWFYFRKPSIQAQKEFWITLAAAASLTCLQWLPFLDMLTWAKPGAWTDYPYFDRPLDYLTLLKPDALGLLGSATYRGPFANGIFNLYFGLVPLGILAWNVLAARRLPKPFWTFSTLFWFFWMAGPHFPLWNLLPLGLLQWLEPSKAVGLFLFCAVTSVALSLQSFLEKKPALRWRTGLMVLLSVVWLLDLLRLPSLLLHPIEDPYQQPGLGVAADKIKTMLNPDQVATGDNRKGMLTGVRILSLDSMGRSGFTGSLQQALAHDAESSVQTFKANSNAVWGLRSADRYLFLQVDGSENLVRYYNKGFPYKGDLLDAAGVNFFLMPQPLQDTKYLVVSRLNGEDLIRNFKAASDLRWVGEQETLPDRASVLETLARADSRWEHKVYLDQKPDGTPAQLAPVGRRSPTRGGLPESGSAFERPNAGHATWEQNGFSNPGFIAFNETYAPGWHAWVDGSPQPILRAYGLFMAVAVEAGSHQVEFRYEPSSFRLGLFISLLSLAVLVASFGRKDNRP